MDGPGHSGVASPSFQRTSVKRSFSTMAASHRDDSPDPSLSLATQDDHYDNEHSARRRRVQASPVRPSRYVGDGLDFRRPVAADGRSVAPREEMRDGNDVTDGFAVIDLTEDDGLDMETDPAVIDGEEEFADPGQRSTQSLPGNAGNVIEVVDEEDEPGETSRDLPGASYLALPGPHRAHPRYSILRRPAPEEIRAMEEWDYIPRIRPHRGDAHSHPRRLARYESRRSTPLANSQGEPIDLTGDDGDDVVITEARTREGTGVNLERPAGAVPRALSSENLGNIAGMLRDQGGRLLQRLNQVAAGMQDFRDLPHPVEPRFVNTNQFIPHLGPPPPDYHRGVPQLPPQPGYMQNFIGNMMNYDVAAFNLGHEDAHRPASSPKYSPPPPPEFGFTRSPEEDEIVVCPNCGDELAVGDTELKQQIWVIKACGHAYCGECAVHRTRSTAKKGKSKGKGKEKEEAVDVALPPPFKTCVVPNCDKSTKGRTMIHVYLGS